MKFINNQTHNSHGSIITILENSNIFSHALMRATTLASSLKNSIEEL